MQRRGKLIVFEGPDGVGKSTLASALTQRLQAQGIPSEQLSFPGRAEGSLGRLIYRLHHHPHEFGIASVSPASLQLLHVAAHVDLIERKILPFLNDGHWVILDRYWWSTWAYGMVTGLRSEFLEALIRLEDICWRRVRPEAVILLLRSASRRPRLAPAFLKLETAYRTLAKRRGRFDRVHIMENTRDRDIPDLLEEIHRYLVRPLNRDIRGLESKTVRKSSRKLAYFPRAQRGRIGSSQVLELNDKGAAPYIFTRLTPAEPSEVYRTYWRFAHERQEIFFRKMAGQQPPWSQDPILQRHRFTNAYRASDRVSQFLISRVIYRGDQSPKEVFFRTVLFKLFNRVETWQALEQALGEVRWAGYSFRKYDEVLTRIVTNGGRIYSAAYIMPPVQTGLVRKHRGHLRLLELMMADEVPFRVVEADSMRQVFGILRSYPGIGNFLAYQFAIDLNYSEIANFSEMEFVVPGPGALDGIHKCFESLGSLRESDVIKCVAERQTLEFANLGLSFQSLWGRPLQLVDCQNLFCEVGKYARIAHPHMRGKSGRKRIKQVYRPNPAQINYWYPPKWGLNQFLAAGKDN